MDSAPAVETRNLTKRYGERIVAVRDLQMTIGRGEIYGFLGPNGAGKTTTLRMLAGLIAPSSGNATVLGQPPGSCAAIARTGALIETPAFYPYLSGRDNLRFLARYAGVPRERAEQALAKVQLSSRGSDRFDRYSLGMKQRLGVAAALLKEPDLLILDEPANGLDPAGMADMRELIRGLGREGKTVLVSSHLMGEVEQVCDRVGIIRDGTLVAEGTIDALRGRENLLIRAEPLEAAQRIAVDLCSVKQVEVAGEHLRIHADAAAAAAINRALVTAGIAVSEITRERSSLEQVFLELTQSGGNEHAGSLGR